MANSNVLADRVQDGVQADQTQNLFEEMKKANDQHEQDVNQLFREKWNLDQTVSDQERQSRRRRGDRSREIEALEAQCSQLRKANGDLQGKRASSCWRSSKSRRRRSGQLTDRFRTNRRHCFTCRTRSSCSRTWKTTCRVNPGRNT
jgi:hypothetical protein